MLVIGITGRASTGKTTVTKLLGEEGFEVLDGDTLAHQTYEQGTQGFEEIVEAFGDFVINLEGGIDRSKLRKVAFSSKEDWDKLNSIVWPKALEIVEEKMALLAALGKEKIVLEAAEMYRAKWHHLADLIWLLKGPSRDKDDSKADILNFQEEFSDYIQQAENGHISYRVLPNEGGVKDLKIAVSKLLKDYEEN